MKKMPTIFLRDFIAGPKFVTRDPNPDCDWVFDGDGVATRKYDGTCCMYNGAAWYKRREVKPGKVAPDDFVEVDHDKVTGKRVGWLPVNNDDIWHMEGIANTTNVAPGTYELCGPKVQGNPEGFPEHVMVPHASAEVYLHVPRDFDGIKEWLRGFDHEGLVFHHPDGRMAKIKRKDFDFTEGD